MKISVASALILGLVSCGAAELHAATIRVPADQPTIQAAIDMTDGDDTVVVSDGVWTGTGNYDLTLPDTTIVIKSLHGPEVTIIDLEGPDFLNHRAFALGQGSIGSGRIFSASIIGFTIRNGIADYGGAISGNLWDLTLRYCIFEVNRASLGGALYCESCRVDIDTCRFRYNLATTAGGAIYGPDSGSVSTCDFEFNNAPTGGAMAEYQRLAIDDCSFYRNTGQYGSALRPLPGDSVYFTLTRSTFVRNQGDAALFMVYGSAQLDHCTFFGNPGAIVLTGGSPTVTNSIFVANAGKPVICYDVMGQRSSDPYLTWCCIADSGLDLAGCDGSFYTMPNNFIGDPLFCDSANNDLRLQSESPCVGSASDGSTIGAEGVGCIPTDIDDDTDTDPDNLLPTTLTLDQNYPNPFNPSTEISFTLPHPTDLRLVVYNVTGQQVAILANGLFASGRHTLAWRARDDSGAPLSSGVYFYRLETGTFTSSKKMLLLK